MVSPAQNCQGHFSFFNSLYLRFVAGDLCVGFAYFVPYNLLYKMMISRGQTKEHSSLALSLAGAGSIVARVFVGFMGDFKCCNRIYYFIFAVALPGFITLACVHLTAFWQFLTYGFLYGMASSKFISGLRHVRISIRSKLGRLSYILLSLHLSWLYVALYCRSIRKHAYTSAMCRGVWGRRL